MSTRSAGRTGSNGSAPGGESAHVRVAILGAGFTGLAAVAHLREEGLHDFLVLERADDVGGVWRDNTYPGIACDVPSHLYSLSFAPNPDWRRTFSTGDQIWEYTRKVAAQLQMGGCTRFGEEVLDASWDEEHRRWAIRTTTLELTADLIIDGTGVLADPTFPQIPGLEQFRGKLFHSARWDHDHDLTGERIAVVGTGASAVQIVPAIQPQAGRVTVFQRTPAWVLPRVDREISSAERRLLRAVPLLQRALRLEQDVIRDALMLRVMRSSTIRRVAEAVSRLYLRRTVADPELRAKLVPDFELGCKRILITSTWYPALAQPNVDVETSAISEVRAHSILTEDGAEHEIDTLVCATGFHVADPPIAGIVHGRGGRLLAEVWGDNPRTYRGITVGGFPNYFRIGANGTGTGHTSQILQIESGIRYVVDALRVMEERGLATVDVKPDAQAAYARRLHDMAQETVWVTGGCDSWYLDASGEASALWPSSARRYRRWTERFDVDAYAVERDPDVAVRAGGDVRMVGA